ncbi:hypothetical protein BDZ90DRAFT_261455 [Jaminaea rosea]|uniref:UBX domain-containing protein n=1 Tax=Jaminaea rosea TaxID=1569628 RepID=A0A316UPG1_9BASI|nr:hypothetical protein BDZ90DRAFT_261455 [Jaminaea rosea]PWN26658.1 hypothetical protein BDZ90DRAFT_261455 [Jaminaea rosea]
MSSPLALLRGQIEAAGVPSPEEGTLLALLAATGDDPAAACRLVLDDHNASSGPASTSRSSSSAVPSRQTARARRQPMHFAEAQDEQTYQALLHGYDYRVEDSSSSGLRRRPAAAAAASPHHHHGGPRRNGSATFAEGGILALLLQGVSLPFSLLHSLLLGLARLLRLPDLLAGIFPAWGRIDDQDRDGREEEEGEGAILAAEQFAIRLAEVAADAGAGEKGDDDDNAASLSRQEAEKETSMASPPLLTGRYNSAIQKTKDDLAILLVALVSGQKRKEAEERNFLRALTHKDVATALHSHTVGRDEQQQQQEPGFPLYLWGSTTLRREGALVSRQLGATRLPQLVCIALHPTSPISSSSSSPHLRLVSRLVSPSLLSSPSALAAWINQDCRARCSPYLSGLAAERVAREAERRLMAEQDAAYREAARVDAERVAKRREEERERMMVQEGRVEREKRRREERRERMRWRKWVRQEVLPPQPLEGQGTTATTTTIHAALPNGKRMVRRFAVEEPVEHVYLWIEVEGHSAPDEEEEKDEDSSSSTPAPRSSLSPLPSAAAADPHYTFILYYGYPRKALRPDDFRLPDAASTDEAAGAPASASMSHIPRGLCIKDIEGLSPRANVIVESARTREEGSGSGSGSSSSSSGESDSEEEAE